MINIGIVLVTYNSQRDINRFFDSILMQKYRNLVVYVVDNNSNDETLTIIRRYQSQISICIISCRVNNGYAKGNNIGIQKAMDEGCELVFILNPDMQLAENCIDILTNRIMSDEKLGVVGPIVLYGNEPDNIIQGYGVNANFRTQKRYGSFGNQRLTNKIPIENYVDFAHGGAMMIRSSVLKITGLFEEDYFMYNDEMDISYRIKNAGFQILCLRDARAKHFHNFDKQNKKGHNFQYYYSIRNKYLYYKKYHFYSNLIISLIKEFAILPLEIRWAIKMKNIKLIKFYYSGLFDGLLGKKGRSDKTFS